jgi:hypothetical protein
MARAMSSIDVPMTSADLLCGRILALVADEKLSDLRVALDLAERFLDKLKSDGMRPERLSDLKGDQPSAGRPSGERSSRVA